MRGFAGLLLLLSLSALAQSPFDGSWKMNLSSAQFEDKPDIFALQNGRYSCSSCTPTISVAADGADQAVGGDKDYDTLAVKTVDDKTVEFTRKKAGKIVGAFTDTVSPDGSTLTLTFKDYLPEGQRTNGNIVFTRAAPAPKGAHPISGAWRTAKVENLSEQDLRMILRSTPDGLSMELPFYHESYEAKFDGKEYPVKGEVGGTVSLKKVNGHTILETRKRDGKILAVNELRIHGETMMVLSKDPNGKAMMSFTAEKQ